MQVEFWSDHRGRVPVSEYLLAAERHGETGALATFYELLGRLEERGPAIGMPHSRMIDRRARLYELRFGAHRIAYAERGGVIVLLHAWRKRSQRLDRREVAVALRRLASF